MGMMMMIIDDDDDEDIDSACAHVVIPWLQWANICEVFLPSQEHSRHLYKN